MAVVSSKSDYIPGHTHLDTITKAVEAGIRNAGGVPFTFNTIGVCDGLAMNHLGMKYSLCSRELIADSIEVMLTAHPLDAVVFIPNCDKIVPGMLLAACPAESPFYFCQRRPMLPGTDGDKKVGLNEVFEAVGSVAAGTRDESSLHELEETAALAVALVRGCIPANSMNCLTEAIGGLCLGTARFPR